MPEVKKKKKEGRGVIQTSPNNLFSGPAWQQKFCSCSDRSSEQKAGLRRTTAKIIFHREIVVWKQDAIIWKRAWERGSNSVHHFVFTVSTVCQGLRASPVCKTDFTSSKISGIVTYYCFLVRFRQRTQIKSSGFQYNREETFAKCPGRRSRKGWKVSKCVGYDVGPISQSCVQNKSIFMSLLYQKNPQCSRHIGYITQF